MRGEALPEGAQHGNAHFGPLSGLLDRRFGPKVPLFLGAASVTVAFAIPALGHGWLWLILVSGAFSGAGIGLAFAAMSNAIIGSVPRLHEKAVEEGVEDLPPEPEGLHHHA